MGYGAVVYAVVVIASAILSAMQSDNARFESHQAQDAAREQGEKAIADAEAASRGQQLNITSTQEPLKLIYGMTRVGINRVYIGTAGTTNDKLHMIGNIGEGEIEGIAQVDGVDQVFLDDIIYYAWGSYAYYEMFNGSATQNPCYSLSSVCTDWNDAKRYCAYLYLYLYYNADDPKPMPEVTVTVKGLKVYDPRGGFTAYSNNPALCAMDFITRSSRRGGLGIPASRLDEWSFIDAANYCDSKSWTCNLALYDKSQTASDMLAQILATFRGGIIYSNGKFKCRYRDLNYEATVMSLTEADVIEITESTLRIKQPSIFDTPNALRVKYCSQMNKYQTDDYVLADSVAIANEGDYREETVQLMGIDNASAAMKMASYLLERYRINKEVSHSAGSRCMVLEAFDIISLTHSIPGWVNKILRITSVNIDGNGIVGLSYQEEDVIMYDDVYDIELHNYHDTNLPDPSAPVPSVINIANHEEVYTVRGRSFTRWVVTFDPPVSSQYPFWDYADILVQIGAGDYNFMTKSRSGYVLDPVEEGQYYAMKIVSVSVFGRKQDPDEVPIITKVISGSTGVPANMTSITAVASGDSVSIYGNPVSGSDIVGYELRLGASWDSGVIVGVFLDSRIKFSGVRPGTFVFWLSPVNNSGKYSATPVSVSCTVFYPSGYTDKNTWSWDFTTGTHSNTEHCTYNSQDALKCSHTGGVLTGTWTSPEYDLGSLKTIRTWGDFLMYFASGALTWAGGLGADTRLWSDVGAGTKRWYELFTGGATGAKISATIMWGTVSGTYPNQADFFQLLAPEFSARYIKVAITISDPSQGSNLYLYKLNMKAAYWA